MDFEFGSVYLLDGPTAVPQEIQEYAPAVSYDPNQGLLIDGETEKVGGWEALTGFTGQYGYNGPIMHTSECWTDAMLESLRILSQDGPLSFTLQAVESPCYLGDEPCLPDEPDYCWDYGCDADLDGWVVLYEYV